MGYLWGVLAAPIPRWTIVLGRILGGTTQGFLQGALLLAVAPWIGLRLSMGGIALVLGAIGLLALGLTAFGFLAAWHSESVAGFHAVMSLILMPMWALSGALFPAEGVPSWMRGAMLINPMRYGVAALQEGLLGGSPVPSPLVWGVLGGFGLLAFALSVWTVSRPPRGDRLPEPIEGGRSTP
ncbi:MAG: hypothetical protein KatS3mg115_0353 [Candidatus Poribacteria bacterium]|nr:MAG: hypothetical protein KatS3mg115_0353 [Candidatus Poribacteria bacterium]